MLYVFDPLSTPCTHCVIWSWEFTSDRYHFGIADRRDEIRLPRRNIVKQSLSAGSIFNASTAASSRLLRNSASSAKGCFQYRSIKFNKEFRFIQASEPERSRCNRHLRSRTDSDVLDVEDRPSRFDQLSFQRRA